MVDLSAIATQAWFVILLSLIIALLVFPLVVVTAFLFDYLAKRHEKTPKILLMLACTFVGVLIAVVILEIYFGYTLPQLFTS